MQLEVTLKALTEAEMKKTERGKAHKKPESSQPHNSTHSSETKGRSDARQSHLLKTTSYRDRSPNPTSLNVALPATEVPPGSSSNHYI